MNCMLDSSATDSFVHPRVVQLTEAQPSEGAVLTVTVANGTKAFCKDVHTLDVTFTAEGETARLQYRRNCMYWMDCKAT